MTLSGWPIHIDVSLDRMIAMTMHERPHRGPSVDHQSLIADLSFGLSGSPLDAYTYTTRSLQARI